MNLTNPKVLMFFLAFLPQFATPDSGLVALQVALVWWLVHRRNDGGVTIAWMAGALGARLRRSPSAQLFPNRVCGVVFAGLATKLLTTSR